MKIRKIWICSVLGAAVLAGAGCAQKQAGATVSQSAGQTGDGRAPKRSGGGEGALFTLPALLKMARGRPQVDSSSPMFRAEKCELTVKDGSLTARMTMSGSGYARVFMGTGEDAEKASESQWIPSEDTREGKNEFTVPVEALDGLLPAAPSVKGREPGMTALSYSERIPFRQRRLRKEI